MEQVTFGRWFKAMRLKEGMSSTRLSKQVGKAQTYVSQIENDKIQHPDYETCYQMLRMLNVNEEKAKSMLKHFGILSSEQQREIVSSGLENLEKIVNKQHTLDGLQWIEGKLDLAKERNNMVYHMLNKFIDRDITRAELVVNNMTSTLTGSVEDFDFFCGIWRYNYSEVEPYKKEMIMEFIDNILSDKEGQKQA